MHIVFCSLKQSEAQSIVLYSMRDIRCREIYDARIYRYWMYFNSVLSFNECLMTKNLHKSMYLLRYCNIKHSLTGRMNGYKSNFDLFLLRISDGGLVSRPDFMGLGLVMVSSLKGLGLVSVSRFKGVGLARDCSIKTTRPERGKK